MTVLLLILFLLYGIFWAGQISAFKGVLKILDTLEVKEMDSKDAFIEKACEYWYQYNRDIVKKHGAKAVLGCSEFTVNVEDFKKYIKG